MLPMLQPPPEEGLSARFALLSGRTREFLVRSRRLVERRKPLATIQFANAVLDEALGRGHIAMFGATGSGKSTLLEILIKSVATDIPEEHDVFNMFIADPQNDLEPALRSMGLPLEIISANVFDTRAWGWEVCEDVTEPAAAEQFAHDCIPRLKKVSGNNNEFFEEGARIIFGSVLRELVNQKIKKWTLLEALLLTLNTQLAERLLRQSKDEAVRVSLRLFSNDQGPTRANLESSVLTKFRKLLTYATLLDRTRNRFALTSLIKSDVILVAGGDYEYQDVLNPAYNLMFTCLKNRLIGQGQSQHRRHWIIADEFAALNGSEPASSVRDFFERGRSRGCRMVITAHSPQQLRDIYGKEQADVLIGMCQHKLIMKVNDPEGAEYLSKVLGNVHGYEWTQSFSETHGSSESFGIRPVYSYGSGRQTSYSHSASEARVDYPEIHASEIMQLALASYEHGFRGFGLVTGNTQVQKWRYHLKPEWLAEHVVEIEEGLATYQGSRRTNPDDQIVRPLSETQLRKFGLDPNDANEEDDPEANLVPWVMNHGGPTSA